MSSNDWNTPHAKLAPHAVNYSELSIMALYGVKAADLSPADFIVVRDRLLQHWQEQQKQLAFYKEVEMSARKVFVDFATDPSVTKGTVNIDLGNGWKAKAVKKENVSFIKNAEGKIDTTFISQTLDKFCLVDGGRLMAERLVKWNPEFSLSEYKQLPGDLKKLADEMIEIKAGSPTLEIIPPKSV